MDLAAKVARGCAIGLAGLGVTVQALLLLASLLSPGPDSVTFGNQRLAGRALLLGLVVVAALLGLTALLLLRRSLLGTPIALLLAVVGTAGAAWGLAIGGGAGSLPLVYWPLLGVLALLAAFEHPDGVDPNASRP